MLCDYAVCIISRLVGREVMHQNWDIVFATAEQNSSKSRNRISELWYKVRFFNPDQTLTKLKFESVSNSLKKNRA